MHVFYSPRREGLGLLLRVYERSYWTNISSDDSDIDIGDSETDDDDVADGENPSFAAADDGEMNDDVDACNDSQVIDAEDSQLDIDDQSTSSDHSVDACLAKLPRLDALWLWGKYNII